MAARLAHCRLGVFHTDDIDEVPREPGIGHKGFLCPGIRNHSKLGGIAASEQVSHTHLIFLREHSGQVNLLRWDFLVSMSFWLALVAGVTSMKLEAGETSRKTFVKNQSMHCSSSARPSLIAKSGFYWKAIGATIMKTEEGSLSFRMMLQSTLL